MMQQVWTTAELEAFEVIELPTREAFTGLSCGLINVDLDADIDVDVDADVDVDGDCKSSGGGGKCK